jgi:hypothetical protein
LLCPRVGNDTCKTPSRLSGEFLIEFLTTLSLKMSMHWVMCLGGTNMQVGIPSTDTATMPVPGQIASEQLQLGPSLALSLRKAWASNLAQAREQSRAQSALRHCVGQFSRGPGVFAIFSFLWAASVRGTPAGRQNADIAQQTRFQFSLHGNLENSPGALILGPPGLKSWDDRYPARQVITVQQSLDEALSPSISPTFADSCMTRHMHAKFGRQMQWREFAKNNLVFCGNVGLTGCSNVDWVVT